MIISLLIMFLDLANVSKSSYKFNLSIFFDFEIVNFIEYLSLLPEFPAVSYTLVDPPVSSST